MSSGIALAVFAVVGAGGRRNSTKLHGVVPSISVPGAVCVCQRLHNLVSVGLMLCNLLSERSADYSVEPLYLFAALGLMCVCRQVLSVRVLGHICKELRDDFPTDIDQ